MADIRIVSVAFNPGDEIADMLDSLDGAFAGSGLSREVVVVNNGGSVPILGEIGGRATIINAGSNLGYGAGNNLGAKGHEGEWLLIVNPDVVFRPGAVTAMLEAADRFPRAGVFGPKILTPEGDVYPSARRFPRLVSGTGHALLGELWPANPWTQSYLETSKTDTTHRVDWLSGSCLLIRTDAFRAVGGFDPDIFMFFEDTMLGEAMEAAGWERVFVHDAVAVHDQGKSWRDTPAPMLRAHHQSAYTYLSRVYSGPAYAPVRLALKAGLKARLALLLRLGRR